MRPDHTLPTRKDANVSTTINATVGKATGGNAETTTMHGRTEH